MCITEMTRRRYMDSRYVVVACFGALLILSCFSSLDASSITKLDDFAHTSWSSNDGIPPVRAIAQTPDGYLWLGTEVGLYRFDGVRFSLWQPEGDQQLPGSAIWSLYVSKNGSLWIGFGSAGIGTLHNNSFTNYPPGGNVPTGGILTITEDHEGAIWAGGQYGFSKFVNGRWEKIGADYGYAAPGAQWVYVDTRGTLYAVTDGLNFGYSDDPILTNTIVTLQKGDKKFSETKIAIARVAAFVELSDGNVWYADMVRSLRSMNPQIQPNEIPMQGGTSMVTDDQGGLWVGFLAGGIQRLTRVTTNYQAEKFEPVEQISGSMVRAALKDREGNIWFGTAGGLDRFRKKKISSLAEKQGLIPDQQNAITSTNDGSLWFYTFSGDTVQHFDGTKMRTMTLPPYTSNDTSRILSIHSDGNNVWLGGSFGLAKFENSSFINMIPSPKRIIGDHVEAITKDSYGDLWVEMSNLSKVGQILRFHNNQWIDMNTKAKFPDFRSRILYSDRLGRVWFGFDNTEVALWDKERLHIYRAKDGLAGGRIFMITGDRAGKIWIGQENGLSRFDGKRFVNFNMSNGFPSSSIASILEDRAGSFWLAGALSILRVTPEELEKAASSRSYVMKVDAYDAEDGLPGPPRHRGPYPLATRSSDGRLWFVTAKGIAVIDPENLRRNLVEPPVAIESIKTEDQTFSASSKLAFPPKNRDIEFRFTALSFTVPQRVRFKYRLEGYDRDWRGPVNSRSASYTNLPHGEYALRVIASNNDGVWNERGATLAFSIAPTFYQTRLFLFFCIAAAGFLAWLIYRWRVHQMTSRLDLQFRERLAERTRIAQDLHDTLLQGVLSTSMQLHVAIDQLPDDSEVKSRLERIVQLMTHVIDEGRNTVRGLRSQDKESIMDLEHSLSSIPHELSLEAPVDYRVITEGLQKDICMPVRDEIYKIAREAVVNAFRHSDAKKIEVEVQYASHHLRVLLRDDGIGIDEQLLQSGKTGHFGLSGMRERAEKIHARLQVSSRAGGGTEVELVVPGNIVYQPTSTYGLRKWFNKTNS